MGPKNIDDILKATRQTAKERAESSELSSGSEHLGDAVHAILVHTKQTKKSKKTSVHHGGIHPTETGGRCISSSMTCICIRPMLLP